MALNPPRMFYTGSQVRYPRTDSAFNKARIQHTIEDPRGFAAYCIVVFVAGFRVGSGQTSLPLWSRGSDTTGVAPPLPHPKPMNARSTLT